MRTSPCRGYGRPIVFRAALLTILAVMSAGVGSAAQDGGVPWSSFTLQASRLGSTATVRVEVDVLPAAAETSKFIESRRGQPLHASGAEVQKLSVTTTLDVVGGRQVRFENRLWLDPLTHTPLYLIRSRVGFKDYYQRFRFTREGVFRFQREPASVGEVNRPPESWSKLGEHFYPYPRDPQGCASIIETSMLITRSAADAPGASDPPAGLCVFHKRQVHRVHVHPQPEQEVRFDYLEKRGGREARRMGAVSARLVSITSRPIGSYRGQVEDFFGDGTQLLLSSEDRLPLAVSGELPLIGRVEMRLNEVHFR